MDDHGRINFFVILFFGLAKKKRTRFKNILRKMMQWNLMFVMVCRETGLDCDFVIKGNTKEEFLRNGADHVINQHGIGVKEIYWDKIPGNFLCQSFGKPNT